MSFSELPFYASSDIGLRNNNQDFWISLPKESFFALADGMGGHNAGEVAAKQAIELLSSFVKKEIHPHRKTHSLKKTIFKLTQGIHETNNHIFRLSKDDGSLKGMGTTLCCLYFQKEKAIYAHVGDSRIYLFRDNHLVKLTDDHSLIQKWREKGSVEKSKKTTRNYKNVITRAIGAQKMVVPEVSSTSIQKNDVFFLCSDGLTDYVSEKQILQILQSNSSLKIIVELLILLAKTNGSKDNITILMTKIDERMDLSRQ